MASTGDAEEQAPKALSGVGSGNVGTSELLCDTDLTVPNLWCPLPSRLVGLRSFVISPSSVRPKTHFWHILGHRTLADRKMRFLPSVIRKINIFV